MNTSARREKLLEAVKQSKTPISAASLAKIFNVSRQVIVGDIALLRAQKYDIIATARGYIIPEPRNVNQYLGTVVCRHGSDDTREELYLLVDLGAVVVNVMVEHEMYGEITGQLNIKTREDVDAFMNKIDAADTKLLSELTSGVHSHTIACCDKAHFEEVRLALEAKGYLLEVGI